MRQDLALCADLYEFTMAEVYFRQKRTTCATFDLFVRGLPRHRAYLVACGLTDVLDYVTRLQFARDDIAYLKDLRLFSPEFLRYVSGFRFCGDIWALPEGTIFFANEPVLRVTASLIEAQLIESFLLTTINLQTMIASKASRVVNAAHGKGVFDFSLRRTHGAEAGLKVARASYIAGCQGTSNVLAGKRYGIPVAGTMAHSFVMSFKTEMQSFLAYCAAFPNKSILLVDTYDTKKGILNALRLGEYLKGRRLTLAGIRLDSGDIVSLSKFARQKFDAAGLEDVKIFASGNLDEFVICDLLERGARVDHFGVGTHMGTCSDAPSLDVIYKLSEVTDRSGRFLPTMKLSFGKVTYPGRKQVFRVQNRLGRYIRDIVALEHEKINGEALLVKVVDAGRMVYRSPSLGAIRSRLHMSLSRFSPALKEIGEKYRYPVAVSPRLQRLRRRLVSQLKKRQ